jgi:hypothetical protein
MLLPHVNLLEQHIMDKCVHIHHLSKSIGCSNSSLSRSEIVFFDLLRSCSNLCCSLLAPLVVSQGEMNRIPGSPKVGFLDEPCIMFATKFRRQFMQQVLNMQFLYRSFCPCNEKRQQRLTTPVIDFPSDPLALCQGRRRLLFSSITWRVGLSQNCSYPLYLKILTHNWS